MTVYIDRTGEPDDVFEREVLARVGDPVTAPQPATQGSDREVCACGHGRTQHSTDGVCGVWVSGGLRPADDCTSYRPAAPSEPPAADSPETCYCRGPQWHDWGSDECRDDRPAAASPVDTVEAPAEAQQDDERWPDAVLIEGDWISPRKEAHARDLTKAWADAAKDAGCPPRFVARMRTFVELHDRLHTEAATLAARPSADTETLRADPIEAVAVALWNAEHGFPWSQSITQDYYLSRARAALGVR